MRRFALAIIVALLAFSASGASTLIVAEPCTGLEQTGNDDAACPPTCLTCGCCAQAAEPVVLFVTESPDIPVSDITEALPPSPIAQASDILHVPRPHVA